MTRYLMGLVVVTGLTIVTASDASAQVPVRVGNPFAGRVYTNFAAPAFGVARVFPQVAPAGYHHRQPRRVYVAPRYYGGYASRYHHRHHHRHHGYRW